MKTEIPVYPYTVENIQMIFNRLDSFRGQSTLYWFSVTADDVEIIPKTRDASEFLNFLHYDFSTTKELVFTIHDWNDNVSHAYRFLLDANDAEKYIKGNTERLENEVKILQREIRKMRRRNLFEKPDDIKVMDAGNCIVLFVPKDKAEQWTTELVNRLRKELRPFEIIHRYFKRYLNNQKTK
jgi:hypothetical protein